MDPLRLQQAAVKMFLAFFTARLQTLIANLLILIKSQVLYNFSVQIRRLTSNNILRFRSDYRLLVQNGSPACRPIFKVNHLYQVSHTSSVVGLIRQFPMFCPLSACMAGSLKRLQPQFGANGDAWP